MITVSHKGDFSKTTSFLQRIKAGFNKSILDKYGQRGVAALMAATPVDTGKTAASWYYTIDIKDGEARLSFNNSNVVDYVQIAVILQYGHATKNGGWVQGRDYINPAIQPIFDEIANAAWREVTKA